MYRAPPPLAKLAPKASLWRRLGGWWRDVPRRLRQAKHRRHTVELERRIRADDSDRSADMVRRLSGVLPIEPETLAKERAMLAKARCALESERRAWVNDREAWDPQPLRRPSYEPSRPPRSHR